MDGLKLVSTQALAEELLARFEAGVFIGYQTNVRVPGDEGRFLKIKGQTTTVIGLLGSTAAQLSAQQAAKFKHYGPEGF